MNLAKIALLSLVAVPLLYSTQALSLPEDKDKPISISADSAIKNEKKGFTIYEGDVVITQGSVRIKGDKITIYDSNGEVKKILAKGKPAHFRQRPTKDSGFVTAQGNNMEYKVSQELLIIKDNGHLKQEGRTTTSNLITYDMKTAIVNAGNAPSKTGEKGKGRVNMVIQPKKK